MGAKRAASGGGSQPKRKNSRGDDSKPVDTGGITIPSEVRATFVMYPFLNKVLEQFDQLWNEHQDIVAILDHLMGSNEEQLEWFQFLSESFPPENDVEYMTDFSASGGLVALRPFMLPWKRATGNKGYVMHENFRNLVQLILARGFLTSPLLPGVEALVVSEHNKRLVDESMYSPTVEEGYLGASTFSLIKGWSRSCAMHLVLKLANHCGILNQFKDYLGDRCQGFSTVHCNFRALSEDEDIVDINRGAYVQIQRLFQGDIGSLCCKELQFLFLVSNFVASLVVQTSL